MFDSSYLLEVRRKALRSRIWFKILDDAERAILSLVPRCVNRVKSPKLIDAVAKILVKIQEALKSPLERFKNQVAKPLAYRISAIARKWGNKHAKEWPENEGFVQYLAIVKFNDLLIFRVGV